MTLVAMMSTGTPCFGRSPAEPKDEDTDGHGTATFVIDGQRLHATGVLLLMLLPSD